jgi:ATP-dependent DNA ligase
VQRQRPRILRSHSLSPPRCHRVPLCLRLIELNGDDLRRDPLEVRKATLVSALAKAGAGIRLNEHIEHEDGATVFAHACKLGLEGIVSKRKDSAYRSGRSPDWLKMKNSNAPAVKREAGEEWGKKKGDGGQEPDHDLRPAG